MADRDQELKPEHRRRAIAWSLIALALVVLILSMIANWVQTELLDTSQVRDQTDQMLEDPDVEQQLSIHMVDQLYATVDVEGQIQQRLPSSAQALAAPISAATRQLATDVAERALASPRVQDLLSTAVGRAQERFVDLIEDESQFVSTTGGEVTLEYGEVVADLAARLGVDPATISDVQGIVQELSVDLRQRLTAAEAQIKSVRAALFQANGGELSGEVRQDLRTLQADAARLEAAIASLERKLEGVQDDVPAQLQGRLSDLEGRLSDLDGRLATVDQRAAAVSEDPSQANVETLDSSLAQLEARIRTLLHRQIVQQPGELVLMESSQLTGLQDLVGALRSLGFVLPLLALLLYAGPLYLAEGWRRQALITAGGGILGATLLVLLARRLLGGAVVDSIASSEAVKPAISSIWDIVSEGLRQRALVALVIGLAFVGGGLLAGPGRHAVAVRRFLAPYLRDRPVAVYAVVAVPFLAWLAFIPGIDNLGQVLVIVALAVLATVGVEILRRQTAGEFPARRDGP